MPRSEQLDLLQPKQPKEPNGGQVIPMALHTEMQRSYLEYAMSVIVGRALPDVRDGLKPVHRRIIFAMHELGLTPDRPYRKCARVVGDVLGKYHPHGDQSVYDALVRLVQDFSSRYPLLAGHGNFGSVDNDPAAAMRYTETRLAPIAHEAMLGEISQAVIDFADNFDASQQEPVVLPAQLPILLLNGSSGIAVGMATNIPPHNLGEVVDGAIALIDNPELSDAQLFELIPAPDFPTGGIIVADRGIQEAYTTGKGSIVIRGVVETETLQMGKNKRSRLALIVTELPFQVNKAAWIEKMAELVNQGKLEGIIDIRDESDRTGMRVVIELKKEVQVENLLEQLYRQTALQINFGVILLALVGSQPKQLSLRQILQHFLQFREDTLTRQFQFELQQKNSRLGILAGLAIALVNLDRLIPMIRNAANTAAAKLQLQTEFSLSPEQSEAILQMPLRRLTGLERENLTKEQTELAQQVSQLEKILGDRRELLKVLKKELRSLKKKHGDERRTQIFYGNETAIETSEKAPTKLKSKASEDTNSESSQSLLVPTNSLPKSVEETILHISYKGYLKRVERDRAGKMLKNQVSSDDVSIAIFATFSDRQLLIFGDNGKVFSLEVDNLDISSKNNRGKPLITLLPDSSLKPVAYLAWKEDSEATETLVVLTHQAKIKRSPLSEFIGITARGLIAIKLKEDDKLVWAGMVKESEQLAIATSAGRILRMSADREQIPIAGRATQGNQAMRLRSSETVGEIIVATIPLDLKNSPDTELLLISKKGYIKRVLADMIRLCPRNSIGSQAINFKHKTDNLAVAISIPTDCEKVNIIIESELSNRAVRILQIPIDAIPLEPCNGHGKYLTEIVIELGMESSLELTAQEKIVEAIAS
jgi:DNA gyrase subunit A